MKLKMESERKFLVKKMPRSYLKNRSKEITQWYICLDPPIRVRVEDFEDCCLTIKTDGEIREGYKKRSELNGEILKDAAFNLAAFRKHNKIRKTRYLIGVLELDVFLAQLEGLVLLEFERESDNDAFEMPADILAEEVTCDERFENQNLIKLDCTPEEWRCEII